MSSRAGRAIFVFAVAAAVVFWREAHRVPSAATMPSPAPSWPGPRIVVFVDLGEADETEGCGAIIRAVRRAAKSGVTTEEIDARSAEPAAKYRILVAPAVLILDAAGHELARFEGESPRTVRAIEAALGKLTAQR